MSMAAQQKSVLITGFAALSQAECGIGFALANEYKSRGLRVFATARRSEVCAQLSALGFEVLELDVKSGESVEAARHRVAEMTGGTLNILVNNAGIGYARPATDHTMEQTKEVFEINLFGAMRMVQAFLPLLRASGDGRIVNIGSVAGVMPYVFDAPYVASKAALHAYGNTLRLELVPFGVQVLTIISGGVTSNAAQHTKPLDPNSLYAPIADQFWEYRAQRSQHGAMPTEAYAREVAYQSPKRRMPAFYWTGTSSRLVWFVDAFFGRTGFDWALSHLFGLNLLKRILKDKKEN